jgi:hypothetical protein
MNEEWDREPITLSALKDLLPRDDWQIVPNRVGNLSVLDQNGRYVGHITLAPWSEHMFIRTDGSREEESE